MICWLESAKIFFVESPSISLYFCKTLLTVSPAFSQSPMTVYTVKCYVSQRTKGPWSSMTEGLVSSSFSACHCCLQDCSVSGRDGLACGVSPVLVPSSSPRLILPSDTQQLLSFLCHREPFLLTDSDRAGAQRHWKNQGAECPHAGPPGLQRPATHPPLHGAYSEGNLQQTETGTISPGCLGTKGVFRCSLVHWTK